MGKRGPRRTPLKVLASRGSWLADTRAGEPTPPAGRPKPPKGLDKKELVVWKNVVPMVDRMGLLGKCDAQTLARYCVAVVLYWDTKKVIMDEGMTQETERFSKEGELLSSRVEDRPEVRRLKMLSDECRMLENLFGLNPGARASLSVDKPADPMENRGKRKKAFPGAAS